AAGTRSLRRGQSEESLVMKRPPLRACLQSALVVTLASGVGAEEGARFRLITVDPGHFHAALVQKFMYADVDPVVHVYAPAGDDLQEHLKRIEGFNTRTADPTRWRQQVHTGS